MSATEAEIENRWDSREEAKHAGGSNSAVMFGHDAIKYPPDPSQPDYDRLLALIYFGTGYAIGFNGYEKEVKKVVKDWYESIKQG